MRPEKRGAKTNSRNKSLCNQRDVLGSASEQQKDAHQSVHGRAASVCDRGTETRRDVGCAAERSQGSERAAGREIDRKPRATGEEHPEFDSAA
jgi:hypothetical protein